MKTGIDESLDLGRVNSEDNRKNGEAIRQLRTEIGVDGVHGRLPQLEARAQRLEDRIDGLAQKAHENNGKLIARIDEKSAELLDRIEPLERGEHETSGKNQLWEIVRTALTSSAAAAAIGIIAKMLGWIH